MKTTSERLAEAMARTRRQWQAQAKAETVVEPARAVPAPAFTIALSREAGARGSAIGQLLGERLGWAVYDRELVEQVAADMNLRAGLLAEVDEKWKGWFRDYVDAFSAPAAVSDITYVRRLVETMLSLALHGDCVIVGRGATVVLPPASTLRVRLVAPLEDRCAVVRTRRGLSQEEAARWVEKTDAERVRFVRDHFRKDPTESRHYDLMLNTSRFSESDCVDLIIEALRRLQSSGRR